MREQDLASVTKPEYIPESCPNDPFQVTLPIVVPMS